MAGVVPVAPAPAPAPAPVVIAYTPPQYVAPPPEEAVVPLWQEPPRQGISIYLFAGAALVVLIMAMMALNSLNIVRLPWQSDGQTQVRPTPTPMPLLTERTEYARADRFLNFSLSPAVAALNLTLPALGQSCNGTLSNSCRDAITATDQQVTKVLAVIDRGEIPPCIAPGMSKIRADFATMDAGLQLALKGFKDDNKAVVAQGLARFGSAGPALQADAKAVDQTLKAQCSTDRTGP
ncbi:MAG TPA: hypothetical protein VGR77_10795 [Candidatus Dormibacteraeota bacterium]|nr:hypothetical protein [Candidatus Dormibacteraeota bacterium]